MDDVLLAVDKLCVSYFDFSRQVIRKFNRAVNQVSFRLKKRETLGIVGESGSGKTSLGRAIIRLAPITSGNIYFKGQPIVSLNTRQFLPYRKKIQMIFQDPFGSLNPRMTLETILKEPLEIHFKHLSQQQQHKRILELLDQVHLPKTALNRYPNEFSGGQRQRIGIARALAVEPELLICDEPVSALDVSIQAQILNLLKSLQKELNLTCLFVGHGLGAVNYVSDRIAVMYLGKIVELGEAKHVFMNPVHPYTNALIQAAPVPDPEMEEKEHIILQGEIGSSVNPPSGCRFHPRCPYATEKCRTEEPLLKVCESADAAGMTGHQVACHYADKFIGNGKAGKV